MMIWYKVKHFEPYKVREPNIRFSPFFRRETVIIWIYTQFLFHWHFIYRPYTR